MSKKDLTKEWLKLNKICKQIRWLTYDIDYKNHDLEKALEILEKLKERIGKDLENER